MEKGTLGMKEEGVEMARSTSWREEYTLSRRAETTASSTRRMKVWVSWETSVRRSLSVKEDQAEAREPEREKIRGGVSILRTLDEVKVTGDKNIFGKGKVGDRAKDLDLVTGGLREIEVDNREGAEVGRGVREANSHSMTITVTRKMKQGAVEITETRRDQNDDPRPPTPEIREVAEEEAPVREERAERPDIVELELGLLDADEVIRFGKMKDVGMDTSFTPATGGTFGILGERELTL